MRLLVVARSPPNISRSAPSNRMMAPQPPGPGLPRQAPSLNMSTASSVKVAVSLLGDGRERPAPGALAPPCRGDDAHAGDALHRAHHVDAAAHRPPARPGLLHEGEAL